jgi:hypothetical protein
MSEPTNQIPLGQAPQMMPPTQATDKDLAPGASIPVTQQPTQPTQAQPTQPVPEPTVPMIAPDGNIADIPQSKRVDATMKGGYKLGIPMLDKDGHEAVIPSDRAQEAMDKGGYKLKDPKQPLTERAMQQSMGGNPMFVDVPVGTKELFERAGREGYDTGAELGMGTVAVMPVLAALAPHIPEIDKVVKIAKALGYTSFGLKELHDIFHALHQK